MNDEDPTGHGSTDELAYRVAYLIAGYIGNSLTQAEHQELDDWVCANLENQRLFEELTDPANLDAWLKWKEKLPTGHALDRMKSKLVFTPEPQKIESRSWRQYAVAASILVAVLVSAAVFKFISHSATNNAVSNLVKDIPPGANRAILTLSDGKIISLDSARKGRLAQQGNISIKKMDSGVLSYQMIDPSIFPTKEEFNILAIPRGGQFRIQLPDGTNVWLNSASTLKYPTVFHGSKRMVELTGEGYFEVAKDPMFPFEVKAGDAKIEVLGTHFDVNAYADEPTLKISLAEGAVKVNGAVTLKPGEEAQMNHQGEIKKVECDLNSVLAWKNGQFLFKSTALDEVMRQVARWYDSEISYEANLNEHFNAELSRDVPVSKLLHFLEQTNRVHFKIEDKKITVMK